MVRKRFRRIVSASITEESFERLASIAEKRQTSISALLRQSLTEAIDRWEDESKGIKINVTNSEGR